jgi:hypothetical protein
MAFKHQPNGEKENEKMGLAFIHSFRIPDELCDGLC